MRERERPDALPSILIRVLIVRVKKRLTLPRALVIFVCGSNRELAEAARQWLRSSVLWICTFPGAHAV